MKSSNPFQGADLLLHYWKRGLFVMSAVLILGAAQAATPQLINYQALLKDSGGDPLNATVNVTFKIWDIPSGGTIPVWTETHSGMLITDGKLSVLLGSLTALNDAHFADTALYMGITIGTDPEISPRSRLASVPYSFRIETIDGASGGNLSGGVQISEGSTPASLVVTGSGGDSVIISPADSIIISATDPAGNPTFSISVKSSVASVSLFDPVDSKDGFSAVPTKRVEITPEGILMFDSTGTDTSVALTATGDISGSGQIQMGAVPSGALATTVFGVNNNASGDTATISGGSNNTASADFATIGGGFADTVSAFAATVAGGYSNKAVGLYSAIGGGWDNYASDLATIGGGWENIADQRATVGGGNSNTASGYGSTVAGGLANKATATSATVAGGDHNFAGASYATVGGGISDSAKGFYSTIAGGIGNTAFGDYSIIGGGYFDTAYGAYSGVASGYNNRAGDGTSDTAAFIGGGRNNKARGKYSVVAGGGGGSLVDSNAASGDYSTVGGGTSNVASGIAATVGGGAVNQATGTTATIAGGDYNYSSGYSATVGGGESNTASGQYSTIGGGLSNLANSRGATVGGGEANNARGLHSVVAGGGGTVTADSNSAAGDYSVISGGTKNYAAGFRSSIGGGAENSVAGSSSNTAIAGGFSNTAAGSNAFIGGGSDNSTGDQHATVGGGKNDTASGIMSTVPGGYRNKASGKYSFAAGNLAKAVHTGAFVWADSIETEFFSSTAGEFSARAHGGFRFYTNSGLTAGVTMAGGASAWSAVSDKSVKKDFREINSQELLEKLSGIPISRWKYIAEESQADHIGPMSQDFYSAFGLGDDDKRISTIDADGVALAAIQALYNRVLELEVEVKKLKDK